MDIDPKPHKHKFIGGMCTVCGDEDDLNNLEILDDSEINDEELTFYKGFGVG